MCVSAFSSCFEEFTFAVAAVNYEVVCLFKWHSYLSKIIEALLEFIQPWRVRIQFEYDKIARLRLWLKVGKKSKYFARKDIHEVGGICFGGYCYSFAELFWYMDTLCLSRTMKVIMQTFLHAWLNMCLDVYNETESRVSPCLNFLCKLKSDI